VADVSEAALVKLLIFFCCDDVESFSVFVKCFVKYHRPSYNVNDENESDCFIVGPLTLALKSSVAFFKANTATTCSASCAMTGHNLSTQAVKPTKARRYLKWYRIGDMAEKDIEYHKLLLMSLIEVS